MSRTGWRPHIESAYSLTISKLIRMLEVKPGDRKESGWHWTRDGRQTGSISIVIALGHENVGSLRLMYSANDREGENRNYDYTVRLESQPMRFGGVRWWFICPYTHKRVMKLYKFGSIEKFCARTAIRPRPTYVCQRLSGMAKFQQARLRLRARLGFPDWDHDAPFPKPKWMRYPTYERLCERDWKLAEQEDAAFETGFVRLINRLSRYD